MTSVLSADAPCPCASEQTFGLCCGPYLSGEKYPPTAEALMRSRYAAFATGNVDHLETTLLPGTRDDFDRAAASEWALTSEWPGLIVRSVEQGGPDDDEGYVEFIARFVQNGQEQLHHETGHFKKSDGRWYYVDGIRGTKPRHVVKIGRNDPCLCGSGKKYKKCCGSMAA